LKHIADHRNANSAYLERSPIKSIERLLTKIKELLMAPQDGGTLSRYEEGYSTGCALKWLENAAI
jgi:hypothetical protein